MDLDFLPAHETRLGAPLGLMSAPGTRRALGLDLTELRDLHRAALLVSLISDEELARRGIADLAAQARAHGIDLLRFPVPDFGVPGAPEDLFPVIDRVLSVTAGGAAVVVHCWAGLGRSGLVAASCLAAHGHAPADAIALVRRHRRFAVENELQARFVGELAERWKLRGDELR